MSKLTLLSTQLAAAMDAIENNTVGLIGAHRFDEIEKMKASTARLFSNAQELHAQIEKSLVADGDDEGLLILKEASGSLDKMERLTLSEGGLVSRLKEAAAARESSREIGRDLRR
jgi:hypothetical protein